MAMGTLTMNVAQLAEAVYLGVLGTEALAAMGFAFPLTITLFAFAGGIGSGASSVIARAMGAGERERAALLVTHAQILSIVVGLVLASAGYRYATEIVATLGAKGEVLDLTVQYLRVYMIGVPFFLLSIVGSTLLRATGSAASPGIIMTIGSVLQIGLGPVLIFGWFGVPELGIAGAAWAYVGSRILSVAFYLVLLVKAKLMEMNLQGIWQSWVDIMHVGAPAIASGLVMPISMLVITRLLAGHGHEVVAAYNVANRVETIAHMILWSCSSSAEPFIGQNWGARQIDRVKRALFLCHSFCLAWGAVTFLFMIVFGATLVGLIDDNPQVVATAEVFFLIIPLSIGFMGMMQVANSSFNARGLPRPALIISLLRGVLLGIPLAVIGDVLWGYTGIFLATAVTNVVLGLLAWHWNRRSVEQQAFGTERGVLQAAG
ncbi:MAG: MATE family efflux transporter [Proteobacteria bacterium]|nr:MATE family efflux transporter [Pseudomonadota bacterium]